MLFFNAILFIEFYLKVLCIPNWLSIHGPRDIRHKEVNPEILSNLNSILMFVLFQFLMKIPFFFQLDLMLLLSFLRSEDWKSYFPMFIFGIFIFQSSWRDFFHCVSMENHTFTYFTVNSTGEQYISCYTRSQGLQIILLHDS